MASRSNPVKKKLEVAPASTYEAMIFGQRSSKVPRFMEGFELAFARHLIRSHILLSSNTNSGDVDNTDGLTMNSVLSRIFTSRRKGKLGTHEVLLQEYTEINKADKAYADDPDKYPTGKTEYGYPDAMRCNFIIYNRHRFERCSCKITEECDDELFCKRHLGEENTYEAEYEAQLMDLESDTDE